MPPPFLLFLLQTPELGKLPLSEITIPYASTPRTRAVLPSLCTMQTLLLLSLISLGGIIGANARYLVSLSAARRWPGSFPTGTLLVNVAGSLLLGFLLTLAGSSSPASVATRLLLGTGFCGAFTTFSTFAFETVALARRRDHLPAALNVLGNVVLCLAGTAAGIAMGALLATGLALGR